MVTQTTQVPSWTEKGLAADPNVEIKHQHSDKAGMVRLWDALYEKPQWVSAATGIVPSHEDMAVSYPELVLNTVIIRCSACRFRLDVGVKAPIEKLIEQMQRHVLRARETAHAHINHKGDRFHIRPAAGGLLAARVCNVCQEGWATFTNSAYNHWEDQFKLAHDHAGPVDYIICDRYTRSEAQQPTVYQRGLLVGPDEHRPPELATQAAVGSQASGKAGSSRRRRRRRKGRSKRGNRR